MQPPKLLVHVDKSGRNPRQPAVALVGGIGDIYRVGNRAQKALKAAFGGALFAKNVKPLFRLDDLVPGFAFDIDRRSLGRDIAAKLDQFPPHGEVVDHLGIIARRIGRDRGPGKAHKVSWPAKLFQAGVVIKKGLQRDR